MLQISEDGVVGSPLASITNWHHSYCCVNSWIFPRSLGQVKSSGAVYAMTRCWGRLVMIVGYGHSRFPLCGGYGLLLVKMFPVLGRGYRV